MPGCAPAAEKFWRRHCSSRQKLSTSRSRLGLSHLSLVPETNFRPNCEGHIEYYMAFRRDDVRRWLLSRSRSFKVTNFDTNRKPVCDFQVNNTKIHTVSYHFSVIAHYKSNYRLNITNTNLYPILRHFHIIGHIFALDGGIFLSTHLLG